MQQYKVQIVLNLCDFDDDPEAITRTIGVVPDVARKKGAPLLKDNKFARRSVWLLYSRAESYDSDISDHIEYFRNILFEKEEQLQEISKRSSASFTVIASKKGGIIPNLFLDKWLVGLAGKMSASIDIDFSLR
jgi:hypothetical protein